MDSDLVSCSLVGTADFFQLFLRDRQRLFYEYRLVICERRHDITRMTVVSGEYKNSVDFAILQQIGSGLGFGESTGFAGGLGPNTGGCCYRLQHDTLTAAQSWKDDILGKTACPDASDSKFARGWLLTYDCRKRWTCHGGI